MSSSCQSGGSMLRSHSALLWNADGMPTAQARTSLLISACQRLPKHMSTAGISGHHIRRVKVRKVQYFEDEHFCRILNWSHIGYAFIIFTCLLKVISTIIQSFSWINQSIYWEFCFSNVTIYGFKKLLFAGRRANKPLNRAL